MRVIDTDTHVWPSVEILKRYADAELLARWDDDLGSYERPVTAPITHGDPQGPWTTLSINARPYDREIGEKASGDEQGRAGGKAALEGRLRVVTDESSPRESVGHDNASGRLEDMDREGVDVHVLIPGTWGNASTALPVDLAEGLYDSYARYMRDFCSVDPARLRGLLVVPAADPQWAVKHLENNADDPAVGGVMLALPEGQPVDDPELEPLWAKMAELDLPMLYHSFFYEPPYFPGYRDIWGNVVVARTAAHPWGAQRILAYLLLSGVFDRHPTLRVGFAETGVGWLPHWVRRLDMQSRHFIGGDKGLKKRPSEYVTDGNVFCGIELFEGEELARLVIETLGEEVLMYQSDYPHSQCRFPDSPATVLEWSGLTDEQMAKLLGGNAERFLRHV